MQEQGHKLTDEHKQKISLSMRGRKRPPLSEETKHKIGLANKFKTHLPHTLETKIKIGNASRGRKHSAETRRKISIMLTGKIRKRKDIPMPVETRKKISEANKGKILSDITRLKISLSCKGRLSPNKGKKLSTEHRKKLSESHKGHIHSNEQKKNNGKTHKMLWADSVYASRVIRAQRKLPNKSELNLQAILNEICPNEYKYVGDGEFILAGKCPDFMNVNGQKKLIEHYGTYWHKGDDPQDRIDLFKRYGYDTLVIWEDELENKKVLKKKLAGFV